MIVKSYTVAGYTLLLQATLNNKSLTSEQKFALIFESEIIEQIKEECLIPDINHEKYSDLGSLEALYEMLDTKRSYLEQLERHN